MDTAFSNVKRRFDHNSFLAAQKKSALKNKIFEQYPDLAQVEKAIQKSGFALTKNVISGHGDKKILQDEFDTLLAKRKMLLSKYHLQEDYLNQVYACPHCKDTGFLEEGMPCRCFQKALQKERMALSGLSLSAPEPPFDLQVFSKEIYEDEPLCAFENMSTILADLKNYLKHLDTTDKGILLLGHTGTGKSFLLRHLGRSLVDSGKEVYYLSAFSLLDRLSEKRFQKNQGSAFDFSLKDAEILIIDDLGTEIVSDYSRAEFLNLLDYRINRGLKTFLASNLSLSDIEDTYQSRFTSRLLRYFLLYKCLGRDLRTQI